MRAIIYLKKHDTVFPWMFSPNKCYALCLFISKT